MGGLSTNTDIFVKVYDSWMDDEQAYLDWVDFFKRHVPSSVVSLLELACGTGKMTQYLHKNNMHYVATDISEAMLMQAKDKLPSEIIIHPMDMQHITLNETFDCVVCAADSMNFNQTLDDLTQMVDGVYEHLHDGGMFVFDVHHPDRLAMFEQAYVETGTIEGIDFEYVLFSENNDLHHEFHWYVNAYPTIQSFVQRVFTKEEIQQAFPPTKWELVVENDQQQPGFVAGEKWLICAKAIKSKGEKA